MQAHEQRADEILSEWGGSLTVEMQRIVLRRLIVAEDKATELEADIRHLTGLLTRIHDIAKNGIEGGDDYEAMRRIEELSGGD